MTALIPFLWFETQAEEAARYYVSIFPNAKLGEIQRFPAGAHGVEGSVMTASFELGGTAVRRVKATNDTAFLRRRRYSCSAGTPARRSRYR
jgi:predicted 3-demethylubiquinone-9 3-methyltransferase (glyoxalase superfamily)